ncbi:MAG: TolC family protein, partial [Sutterella sp.]
MFRYIAAAALCAAVPALAAPVTGAPLGFDEARALLHERADILQADRAEIARAEAEAEAAKSLSGPKIEADVKQIWGTKTIDLSMNTGLGQYAPLVSAGNAQLGIAPNPVMGKILSGMDHISIHQKMDISGPRAALTATLPIYTGGLITAEQEALRHKAGESRADRDIRETRLDADLAGKYWGVQLARSVESLRASMLRDQEEEVRRARRFEKKGLISKIERMAVEVARDRAKRELINAETNTRVAETQLMKALRETSLPELSSPLFVI